MPRAQGHGAEMEEEEAGSGPPLILSPGGLQGALSSYQPVRAELSQAHRVIAYDRRFGGQSNSPLVVQTWDMVCQDVIDLMDALRASLGKQRAKAPAPAKAEAAPCSTTRSPASASCCS